MLGRGAFRWNGGVLAGMPGDHQQICARNVKVQEMG